MSRDSRIAVLEARGARQREIPTSQGLNSGYHRAGPWLVREIERLARENGLTRFELAASINAEPFYAAHGYEVRERSEVVLGNGLRMAAVWMRKNL